jgi:hypothetical protein
MRLNRILVAAALGAAAACSDAPTSAERVRADGPPNRSAAVSQVVVSPNPASVPVGGTVQMTAQAYDGGGSPIAGKTATWSGSAPGIASIGPSGVVTGNSQGQATVFASIDGVVGSASVTVTAPATPPSVYITGPSWVTYGSLDAPGPYYEWTAQASGGNGSYTYLWEFSDVLGRTWTVDSGSSIGSSFHCLWANFTLTVYMTSGGQTASSSVWVEGLGDGQCET